MNASDLTISCGILDAVTKDEGPLLVRWRDGREFAAVGAFAPILFSAAAIGNLRLLRVSPQHCIRVANWRTELWYGEGAVLTAARALVNGTDNVADPGGMVAYHHLVFDRHQITCAKGIATASVHPGEVGIGGMDDAVHEELQSVFPALRCDLYGYGTVHRRLNAAEAQVLSAALGQYRQPAPDG